MARINGIDTDIFPLNLGGNPFGWTSDETTSHAVLDAFVDGGGNFVDTADVYSAWADGHSGGESETVLGNWLARPGNRDKLVVATKVGMWDKRPGLSPANVEAAVEESLGRLQTDHIDLYYIHQPDPSTDVETQVLTFDKLVTSGKIRAIGLSNMSGAQIHEWYETATRLGVTLPAAVQPQYSLVHRKDYETDILDPVQAYDLAVFTYFSLASGFLTGKYRTENDLATHARGAFAQGYFSPDGLAVVDAVAKTADARGVEMSTVALAWLHAKGVTAPIASVSTVDQLPALLASADVQLTDEEVTALDTASAPFA